MSGNSGHETELQKNRLLIQIGSARGSIFMKQLFSSRIQFGSDSESWNIWDFAHFALHVV